MYFLFLSIYHENAAWIPLPSDREVSVPHRQRAAAQAALGLRQQCVQQVPRQGHHSGETNCQVLEPTQPLRRH